MNENEIDNHSCIKDKNPKSSSFDDGQIILIDKPLHWTSFDVVKKIRNTIRAKKIGHAGTLDPLATGLLMLCSGEKTKSIESIQSLEKEYLATICLGGTTVSFDREHEVINQKEVPNFSNEVILKHLASFKGTIMQKPPIFSAIKRKGKKLYDYARTGEKVKIHARKVTIHELELVNLSLPYMTLKITCSKGTYIRSLAHDIGVALMTGAYLYDLKRTRIGKYKLKDAYSLDYFVNTFKQ